MRYRTRVRRKDVATGTVAGTNSIYFTSSIFS